MVALAVLGPPAGASSISSCGRDAVVHLARRSSSFTTRGYQASELFFIIGADAFADIAELAGLPADSRRRALRRRLAAAARRLTTLPPAAAGAGGTDGRRRRSTTSRTIDPLIILIDAPTADVSSTAIREPAGRGELDRRAWCRHTCSNILSSTDFTRRTTWATAAMDDPRIPRQAGCMAKTETKTASEEPERLPAQIALAHRRGGRQAGEESRRARPAKDGGLHRFLHRSLGHQHATGARDRRRGHRSACRPRARSRRTSKATTGPSGFCSTTSTSSCTSSRRRRACSTISSVSGATRSGSRCRRQATLSQCSMGFEREWPTLQHSALCICISIRATRCFGRPRARLRGLRPASRSSDRGPVCAACWQSILPLTPPLCDRCGDPLPTWRAISIPLARCPRCRRGSRRRRSRARDRRLRRRASRHRPRAEIRRPPIAGPSRSAGLMRDARRRIARRGRLRDAGAAAPIAAASARLQSGRRSRATAGHSGHRRAAPHSRHADADGAARPASVTGTCATRSPSLAAARTLAARSSCWWTM